MDSESDGTHASDSDYLNEWILTDHREIEIDDDALIPQVNPHRKYGKRRPRKPLVSQNDDDSLISRTSNVLERENKSASTDTAVEPLVAVPVANADEPQTDGQTGSALVGGNNETNGNQTMDESMIQQILQEQAPSRYRFRKRKPMQDKPYTQYKQMGYGMPVEFQEFDANDKDDDDYKEPSQSKDTDREPIFELHHESDHENQLGEQVVGEEEPLFSLDSASPAPTRRRRVIEDDPESDDAESDNDGFDRLNERKMFKHVLPESYKNFDARHKAKQADQKAWEKALKKREQERRQERQQMKGVAMVRRVKSTASSAKPIGSNSPRSPTMQRPVQPQKSNSIDNVKGNADAVSDISMTMFPSDESETEVEEVEQVDKVDQMLAKPVRKRQHQSTIYGTKNFAAAASRRSKSRDNDRGSKKSSGDRSRKSTIKPRATNPTDFATRFENNNVQRYSRPRVERARPASGINVGRKSQQLKLDGASVRRSVSVSTSGSKRRPVTAPSAKRARSDGVGNAHDMGLGSPVAKQVRSAEPSRKRRKVLQPQMHSVNVETVSGTYAQVRQPQQPVEHQVVENYELSTDIMQDPGMIGAAPDIRHDPRVTKSCKARFESFALRLAQKNQGIVQLDVTVLSAVDTILAQEQFTSSLHAFDFMGIKLSTRSATCDFETGLTRCSQLIATHGDDIGALSRIKELYLYLLRIAYSDMDGDLIACVKEFAKHDLQFPILTALSMLIQHDPKSAQFQQYAYKLVRDLVNHIDTVEDAFFGDTTYLLDAIGIIIKTLYSIDTMEPTLLGQFALEDSVETFNTAEFFNLWRCIYCVSAVARSVAVRLDWSKVFKRHFGLLQPALENFKKVDDAQKRLIGKMFGQFLNKAHDLLTSFHCEVGDDVLLTQLITAYKQNGWEEFSTPDQRDLTLPKFFSKELELERRGTSHDTKFVVLLKIAVLLLQRAIVKGDRRVIRKIGNSLRAEGQRQGQFQSNRHVPHEKFQALANDLLINLCAFQYRPENETTNIVEQLRDRVVLKGAHPTAILLSLQACRHVLVKLFEKGNQPNSAKLDQAVDWIKSLVAIIVKQFRARSSVASDAAACNEVGELDLLIAALSSFAQLLSISTHYTWTRLLGPIVDVLNTDSEGYENGVESTLARKIALLKLVKQRHDEAVSFEQEFDFNSQLDSQSQVEDANAPDCPAVTKQVSQEFLRFRALDWLQRVSNTQPLNALYVRSFNEAIERVAAILSLLVAGAKNDWSYYLSKWKDGRYYWRHLNQNWALAYEPYWLLCVAEYAQSQFANRALLDEFFVTPLLYHLTRPVVTSGADNLFTKLKQFDPLPDLVGYINIQTKTQLDSNRVLILRGLMSDFTYQAQITELLSRQAEELTGTEKYQYQKDLGDHLLSSVISLAACVDNYSEQSILSHVIHGLELSVDVDVKLEQELVQLFGSGLFNDRLKAAADFIFVEIVKGYLCELDQTNSATQLVEPILRAINTLAINPPANLMPVVAKLLKILAAYVRRDRSTQYALPLHLVFFEMAQNFCMYQVQQSVPNHAFIKELFMIVLEIWGRAFFNIELPLERRFFPAIQKSVASVTVEPSAQVNGAQLLQAEQQFLRFASASVARDSPELVLQLCKHHPYIADYIQPAVPTAIPYSMHSVIDSIVL